MTRTTKMIEQYLGGKSASQVFEDLSDVPSLVEIGQDIYRELAEREILCTVKPDLQADILYVILEERSHAADGIIDIYENAYPEYRILVTTEGHIINKGIPPALAGDIQGFIKSQPGITPQAIMSKYPKLKNKVSTRDVKGWIDNVQAGHSLIT